MFLPEPNVSIWLYTQPVDMRKSFDGLSALVVSQLQDDPALTTNNTKLSTPISALNWPSNRPAVSSNSHPESGKRSLQVNRCVARFTNQMRHLMLIDDMTIEQLLELNEIICECIDYLRAKQDQDILRRIHIGNQVQFKTDKGTVFVIVI